MLGKWARTHIFMICRYSYRLPRARCTLVSRLAIRCLILVDCVDISLQRSNLFSLGLRQLQSSFIERANSRLYLPWHCCIVLGDEIPSADHVILVLLVLAQSYLREMRRFSLCGHKKEMLSLFLFCFRVPPSVLRRDNRSFSLATCIHTLFYSP